MKTRTLEPTWEAGDAGNPVSIWENYFVTVLDSSGEPMLFFDIPQGSVVEITNRGGTMDSFPVQLGSVFLIQIVK